jgi:hypothetical protein
MQSIAAKHSLFPMSTKYDNKSSATSVEPDAAAVIMASLKSLSCFDDVIDISHRLFFYKRVISAEVLAMTNITPSPYRDVPPVF